MAEYQEADVSSNLAVSEMPPALRPREKMLHAGPKALSNVELLAVILGAATGKQDPLKIAGRIIRHHGLAALPSLTVRELATTHGVGNAQACRLTAGFELARRIERAAARDPARIANPAEVYAQVRDLCPLKKEHLVGLYLDAQNRLIARETISIGSLNTTRTHPREILYPAIQHLALAFILVHNHPSNTLVPSTDDVEFTRAVQRAGEMIGINLYDHVIVAVSGYVSLKEKGLL